MANDKLKVERVTVTPDELRNGWDDASLRKYLAERNDAQAKLIDPRSEARREKKSEQNHRYRPHRWRA
jgi:hypothetical protein